MSACPALLLVKTYSGKLAGALFGHTDALTHRHTDAPPTLPPPGDINIRAGDVGGFVGEEPEDGLGDLLGGAAALHRDAGDETVGTVGVAAAGVDVGVDDTGAHPVDADAFGGDLFRQADRHGVERALRGGVVDELVGRADARGGGG